ncbi:MAG: FkbM family methyltransferase [Cytophagales bacterium]|nr:FkbM family methyltransferase [Cytophagales bacterium]
MKLRNFNNEKVYIRKNKNEDLDVFNSIFAGQYHIPIIKINSDCTILDLGSNIGLSALHYKILFPKAKIFCYELDRENYIQAKKNLKNYNDVIVENKAIWYKNGLISYQKSGMKSDAYHIGDDTHASIQVESLTIDEIIKKNNIQQIDFLKMDIEGAEIEIFENDSSLDWLVIVNAINIEVHEKCYIPMIVKKLRYMGFLAWEDGRHWSAISGIRNN